jgi:hypothetical protein
MFGLTLAVEAARTTFGIARQVPARSAPEADRDPRLARPPEAPSEAAPVPVESVVLGRASAATMPPLTESLSPEPRQTGAPGGRMPAPAAEEPEEAPAAARAVRPRPTESRRADGANLTLREQGGAVEIVAAGGPMDAESRLHLRRLVEAMLSRSGLVLAHFQLNGAPVAPDFLDKAGGTHGTRTR